MIYEMLSNSNYNMYKYVKYDQIPLKEFLVLNGLMKYDTVKLT